MSKNIVQLLSLCLVFLTINTNADHNEMKKLLPSDGRSYDFFGYSVSIDLDTIVVGSYGDDDRGSNSGSAYIFERSGDNDWTQTAKLTANDGLSKDKFGISVAIDNDIVIIGAFENDNGKGAAYVFEQNAANQWTQTAKLVGSDVSEGDEFGISVDIADGRAVIGAWKCAVNQTGAAYVFTRGSDGGWTETVKLMANDGKPGDRFGHSVSINGDVIGVGAYGEDSVVDRSGAAYIFELDANGNWIEKQKLSANDARRRDWFGYAVNVNGVDGYAVMSSYRADDMGRGSGAAYIFERDIDGVWSQKNKLVPNDGRADDHFGGADALDGDIAIIGAETSDDLGINSGSAYIYQRQSNGQWMKSEKLLAYDGTYLEEFGIAVDIDDGFIVIGAYTTDDNGWSSGSAFVVRNYESCDMVWTESSYARQVELVSATDNFLINYQWTFCDFTGRTPDGP